MVSFVQPTQRVRRLRQVTAVMARLVLVVVAWAGPVPLGHDHGTLVAHGADLPELTEHLARYHDCDSMDPCQGWHLHWVWLGDESGSLVGAARSTAFHTMAGVSDSPAQPLNLAWGDSGAEHAPPPRAHGFGDIESPPSFFGTFSCRRSLPERLGVIRC